MKSVEPLSLEEVMQDPELAEIFAARMARTDYVSNSLRVMARVPGLVRAADSLVNATFFAGAVPTGLKMLMFLMFSSRWGCQYCQAHALVNVQKAGIPDAQIDQLWEFDSSPAFDSRERAVLRLARDAALAGNVEEAHYVELRKHYSEAEIVELVGVLAAGAFLNTWNSGMGTELEPLPIELAEERLTAIGWTGHGHRPAAAAAAAAPA
jgi:alkylhydroperoxidase family enzyme